MRLGQYECILTPGSLGATIYGATAIWERHRHRYEFNCLYEPTLTEQGLRISGRSPDGKFVEMIELPGHPWPWPCSSIVIQSSRFASTRCFASFHRGQPSPQDGDWR